MPRSVQEQSLRLWDALTPQRWPIAPGAFPAGAALVGGAVRDGLLGRLQRRIDLDLVVPVDAVALGRELARSHRGHCVVLDAERSISRVVLDGWTVDLARCMGKDLEEDLGRRDFSVNAMALPLAEPHRLLDPQGGLQDLAERRLRAIGERNLLDDPLRLLRGIRLAGELGFALEPQTWQWIRRHHAALDRVAGERVLAELERLAAAPGAVAGLRQVLEAELLPGGSGAVPAGLLDRCESSWAERCGLSAAERDAALPLARLAAVLDGATLARLHAGRRLQQRCQALRRWSRRLQELARTGGTSPSLQTLGEGERLQLQRQLVADLPALLLQLEPAEARAAMAAWRDPEHPLFHPRPPLDGCRLQRELNLRPGPSLGALLDHLTQERAFGRLPADRGEDGHDQQALTCAHGWLAQRGGRCD
ncbi:MAG: CCA tRNA nucleotidyltransferase [Synechococcaceae cyanobacterium]|nr:CCA tRNA nucleotidyltransferase [Synechococcaceae cyanobacterium]